MPRHELMMWLLAGGGTLAGASLTYLATRPVLAPAASRVHLGWQRLRMTLPAIFARRESNASVRRQPRPMFTRNGPLAPTGSSAFDEYRSMQLANLEHEQREFQDFLQRLRDARDREEFDTFIKEAKSGTRTKPPVTIDNDL